MFFFLICKISLPFIAEVSFNLASEIGWECGPMAGQDLTVTWLKLGNGFVEVGYTISSSFIGFP